LKEYIIYAGVNGAGKSTLYHTGDTKMLNRINSDEILTANGGDWRNVTQSIEAMRKSAQLVESNFRNNISFCQETTLTGNSILKNIKHAKELGYSIKIRYVGLDNADIAVERVEKRVKCGGHGIPENDIRRQYTASLENLKKAVPLCDDVFVYDNTNGFKQIAAFHKGELTARKNIDVKWFSKNFQIEQKETVEPVQSMSKTAILPKKDVGKTTDIKIAKSDCCPK
jgi:predicted ABC-type ATPase